MGLNQAIQPNQFVDQDHVTVIYIDSQTGVIQ